MKVAYVRVSTEEQVKGFSIEAQKKTLIEAFPEIDRFYSDPGFTGSNLDRPGLQSLLSDLDPLQIRSVFVFKLDRLSRNLLDLLILIQHYFLPRSIELKSPFEHLDILTPSGLFTLQVLGAAAQLERESLALRVRSGKVQKALSGRLATGEPPFGYRSSGGDLEIDPGPANVVKRIFSLRSRGLSLREICQDLNSRKIKSKRGRPWTPSTVSYILKNPLYRGHLEYRLDGETIISHVPELALFSSS